MVSGSFNSIMMRLYFNYNQQEQINRMIERKSEVETILEQILNNTTARIKYNSHDYIILIKKQQGKNFCTFFLTDCCDNIWIQKIDADYCQRLKEQMKVKSSVSTFATHFVEAVKKSCAIQEIQPSPTLKLQLKISEGLIINCTLNLTVQINNDQNASQYRRLLRMFFLQLYEAKQAQINKLQKQLMPQRQKQENQQKNTAKRGKDDNYIKSVLNLPQKKEAPQPPPKNRDLINPLKKKRKQHGVKLTGGND